MPTPGKPARIWTTATSAANSVADERHEPENGQVEGRLVTRIRVLDETGKSTEERIPPLPLVTGKPFDFAVERETLRKLYAMGDFSDIRVTTVNQANGVEVNFIVKHNYYNNVIHIDGLREPPTKRPPWRLCGSTSVNRFAKACSAKPSAAWKTLCTAMDCTWRK